MSKKIILMCFIAGGLFFNKENILFIALFLNFALYVMSMASLMGISQNLDSIRVINQKFFSSMMAYYDEAHSFKINYHILISVAVYILLFMYHYEKIAVAMCALEFMYFLVENRLISRLKEYK